VETSIWEEKDEELGSFELSSSAVWVQHRSRQVCRRCGPSTACQYEHHGALLLSSYVFPPNIEDRYQKLRCACSQSWSRARRIVIRSYDSRDVRKRRCFQRRTPSLCFHSDFCSYHGALCRPSVCPQNNKTCFTRRSFRYISR
jgi:hypothetical protein